MRKRLKKSMALLLSIIMVLSTFIGPVADVSAAEQDVPEGIVVNVDDVEEEKDDDSQLDEEQKDEGQQDGEAEESACIESCVEGCTGEECECTCHEAEEDVEEEGQPEESTCIEGCVEGCTGEACECTCHEADESPVEEETTTEEIEEAAMSEAAAGYTEELAALALRIEAFKKMDSASEEYTTEENALWEELADLEESLGVAKAEGIISVEEYDLLFAELDRVINLLVADLEPEEEAAEYAETYWVGFPNQNFSQRQYVWKKNNKGWWAENPNNSNDYVKNAWLREANGTYYYAGEEGYILTSTTKDVDGDGNLDTFDEHGAWVDNGCAVDGLDSNSEWNYYWHKPEYYGTQSELVDLKAQVTQRPVSAKYADVVLGENSAVNVECSIPNGTVWSNAVTESDSSGWGAGLQDCVGALVDAKAANQSTISRVDGDEDYFWVMYHNIDQDAEGHPICVSLSVWDYAIHTGGTTATGGKNGPARIGFTTKEGKDGSKVYVKDNAPGISVNNISWVTVLYEFYTHNGSHSASHTYKGITHTPIQVDGSTSYYDVDGWQGVHVHGSNMNNLIATNGGPVNGSATVSSKLYAAGNTNPYVYASEFGVDSTGYTTSHAFTEEFTTAGEQSNSSKELMFLMVAAVSIMMLLLLFRQEPLR